MQFEFPVAFILTVLLETAVLFLFLRKRYEPKEIVVNCVFVNVLTLPIVWFLIPQLGLDYWIYVVVAELFAFSAETLLYLQLFKKMDLRTAAIASFICNLVSFLAGLAVVFIF